jgi:pimeloyl-ACP methyl ester carboxylesterase
MSLENRSLRFSTDRGVELHCLVWSKTNSAEDDFDAPLVLLHGGGANAHWWDHLAPSFCSDRSVYALDFRGHGDSEHPGEREVGAFNLDLEALIAELGREDVDVVGHSLGAAVALDHASRFPATRSITLIDPARGGTPASGRRARLALSLRRTYASRAEAVERFRFLPESSHASEELRAYIARHSIREEPDGRFGYKFDPAWFGLPSRPRPDPARITCPTLVIRGAESGLLSAEAARELVEALPDGRLEEIPNAGHHVFLDQPERAAARIREFLEGDRNTPLRSASGPA